MNAPRLEDCVNDLCPLTRRPVSADALTYYKGKVVGFADRQARDTFLAAMLTFETAIQPPPVVRYSMPLKRRQKEFEAA
jgi:hypothetical protein